MNPGVEPPEVRGALYPTSPPWPCDIIRARSDLISEAVFRFRVVRHPPISGLITGAGFQGQVNAGPVYTTRPDEQKATVAGLCK